MRYASQAASHKGRGRAIDAGSVPQLAPDYRHPVCFRALRNIEDKRVARPGQTKPSLNFYEQVIMREPLNTADCPKSDPWSRLCRDLTLAADSALTAEHSHFTKATGHYVYSLPSVPTARRHARSGGVFAQIGDQATELTLE